MKTKLLLPLLFLALFSFQANAQEVGDIRVGGGVVYATWIGADIGINVRGDYQFTDAIKGGADFTYYFADEFYSLSSINLNGFYYFESGSVSPYVLAGLNFSIVTVNFDFGGFGSGSVSSTDVGLNLGGGVDFPLSDNVAAFGEGKYVVGSLGELVITAGVKFNLGN